MTLLLQLIRFILPSLIARWKCLDIGANFKHQHGVNVIYILIKSLTKQRAATLTHEGPRVHITHYVSGASLFHFV